MAGLRVFVSSTCYDLSIVRSQLRTFLSAMGYTPIMSDFNDVLYDPRIHTHTSCIDEVINSDMLILIIGSRFGGKGVPEAVEKVDFQNIKKEDMAAGTLSELQENLSITQLEVLKAIESSIPVYTFIEQKVWHDHELYERNKEKEIINQIYFPSIDKQETAKYIFNFINFVRQRAKGNNIFSFSRIQEVEEIIKKQWASYFQKLLNEQRFRDVEVKRLDNLTEQFEDLKTAILSSMGNGRERDVAKGVVKYRKLIDFILALKVRDFNYIKNSTVDWSEFLNFAEIKDIISVTDVEFSNSRGVGRPRTILLRFDDTFFECRFPKEYVQDFSLDWNTFISLPVESRDIIVDTIVDMSTRGSINIRYIPERFSDIYQQDILQLRKDGFPEVNEYMVRDSNTRVKN
ncbi:DUF4062 domain-containing protein [Psychrobacillus sp. Sa2BUA9]|uniref:DUF4062 domain-containing protein n=1 Tax=Psychrobacillus faecigallinarum TaxID=2762235 RepID=A0ABR8RAA1_9BACI|nr:DUF4062 domain-containing protein [Psychrobacillus faecigallinarum]MBD7944726.1 DUF4062 domain-containing protein [Psychrobacillus faecigallinarum]